MATAQILPSSLKTLRKALEGRDIEAALYGLKFAGCSISFEEIEEFTKSL